MIRMRTMRVLCALGLLALAALPARAQINNRNTTANFTSPSNLTLLNSETLADGSLDPNRLLPKNAGFGAATAAQTRGAEAGLGNNYNRVLMLQVRFQF